MANVHVSKYMFFKSHYCRLVEMDTLYKTSFAAIFVSFIAVVVIVRVSFLSPTDPLRRSLFCRMNDVNGLKVQQKRNLAISTFSVNEIGAHYERNIAENDTEQLTVPGFVKHPRKKSDNKEGLNSEAIASMHLAKNLAEQGKTEKALKLYQHAYALVPQHPDVLNEYGEFLEKTQKDVVSAEHLYCRALVISPTHSKALSNRHRTLPVVEEIDQNHFDRIEKKRDLFAQIPENNAALKRAKRESYFKHVHHTTAIEGNTFTLMQTRSLLETHIAVGGKSVMEHQEILGLDAALSYINNTLVTRIAAVNVAEILAIHRRVMGFVDPIEAGRFRETQVFVGDFTPPPPHDVFHLVREFVEWLNGEEALSLHPIELAALAHYRLVYIHPFYDGNGRTSRLLMNLILMQAGYPPITILKEEKLDYYELLQTANNGDVRPFVRFVARCTERTLNEYLYLTTIADNPGVSSDAPFPEISGGSGRDDGRTIILEDETGT